MQIELLPLSPLNGFPYHRRMLQTARNARNSSLLHRGVDIRIVQQVLCQPLGDNREEDLSFNVQQQYWTELANCLGVFLLWNVHPICFGPFFTDCSLSPCTHH